jgi:hypothetical protein
MEEPNKSILKLSYFRENYSTKETPDHIIDKINEIIGYLNENEK